MGYNGRDGWIAASQAERPLPVEFLTGQELDGTRLEAELTFPTRITQALTAVRVGFPVSINDRDVQVVQGTTAGGALVTLYFDMETGLLTRLMRYTDSRSGASYAVRLRGLSSAWRGPDPFKWTRRGWMDVPCFN